MKIPTTVARRSTAVAENTSVCSTKDLTARNNPFLRQRSLGAELRHSEHLGGMDEHELFGFHEGLG